MNQILFTNNNNNNNYNKVDVLKVIKIFSIAIIVVAMIIIGIKVYGIYQEKKKSKANAVPEIVITKAGEQSKDITIKAICEDGIEYLVYTWNNENENRVNLNGSTTFERIIEIPGNEMNTLKVEVMSVKGKSNSKTEVFENLENSIKPTIDSITIADKKLKIEVSDDKGIKYLAYKWENEEEQIINADENDNLKMTTEIDIQRGTYKLYIRVVDIHGNQEEKSNLITGVNEPQIKVIKYGNKVNISVTHDRGIKQIEYLINNSLYIYNEEFSQYDKNKTTVEFDFPLKEGDNIVQVNAYSLEKVTDEEGEELEKYSFKRFTGKCTYEIETEE